MNSIKTDRKTNNDFKLFFDLNENKKILKKTFKIFILLFLIFFFFLINNKNIYLLKIFDINFKYENYQREFITDKMLKKAYWYFFKDEQYFINGIIRKHKPKKCLEIGVARGGSAVLILNALKDIKGSFLISIDYNTKLFVDKRKRTGYIVNKYFPELNKNWKIFTGDLAHKFLEKLNIKFDFVFIDTSHYTPGEIINIIEVMPFLNNNAIVVVHDITWHHKFIFTNIIEEVKFTPTQIYIMSTLVGKKVIFQSDKPIIGNIGAVFLEKNQENYYISYFLLLLSFWEEMLSENQINDLKIFIKKYYKNEIYLKIFNQAVNLNKNYILKYKNVLAKFYKHGNKKINLNNN